MIFRFHVKFRGCTKGFPSLVFVSQVQIGEIYDASLRERLRERKEDVFGDLTPF